MPSAAGKAAHAREGERELYSMAVSLARRPRRALGAAVDECVPLVRRAGHRGTCRGVAKFRGADPAAGVAPCEGSTSGTVRRGLGVVCPRLRVRRRAKGLLPQDPRVPILVSK